MKRVVLLVAVVLGGCDKQNKAENIANFEACVERAENKYQSAFSSICITKAWEDKGQCSCNVSDKNSLLRSKDNEITACATMYAPSK